MKNQSPARRPDIAPALLSDLFTPWNEWFSDRAGWPALFNRPAVNVAETDKSFVVELAAPGMKKKDFDIQVANDMLTISSKKEEKEEETNKKFTRKEYTYTAFRRSFSLPANTESSKIEAKYEDGILAITIPKDGQHSSAPEKIEVK